LDQGEECKVLLLRLEAAGDSPPPIRTAAHD